MMVENFGLFHAVYNVGTRALGAVHLHCSLAVDTVHRTVGGIGRVMQPVHPPLSMSTSLHGTFNVMTIMPHHAHIALTVTGTPHLQPATNGTHTANAHLFMVLGGDWKSGTADLEYCDGRMWHKVRNVPVKLAAGGPALAAVPLHASVLQSAMATGDLAQMKLLEAHAEREVGANAGLHPALEALRAEISKLPGH
jgi:hypothetical protein